MKTRSGQRVTKVMVEALAKEAEAGYDPRSLRPKRVGRPSLGRGISPPVQVRLNRVAHAQLQRVHPRDCGTTPCDGKEVQAQESSGIASL